MFTMRVSTPTNTIQKSIRCHRGGNIFNLSYILSIKMSVTETNHNNLIKKNKHVTSDNFDLKGFLFEETNV